VWPELARCVYNLFVQLEATTKTKGRKDKTERRRARLRLQGVPVGFIFIV
jgi:hypothetical protein